MFYLHYYGDKTLTTKEVGEAEAMELFQEKCGKIVRQIKSDNVTFDLDKAQYAELLDKFSNATAKPVCCRIHQTFGSYTYYVARTSPSSFMIYKKHADDDACSFMIVYDEPRDKSKLIKGLQKALPEQAEIVLDCVRDQLV